VATHMGQPAPVEARGDRGDVAAPVPVSVPPDVRRFVLETAMLAPALPVASAAGKRLVLVSDPWDGLAELRARLERAGAGVQVLPVHRGAPGTPLPEQAEVALAQADGVIHLGAFSSGSDQVDARDVFAMLRPAVAGGASILLAAVGPPQPAVPTLVSGVPGLMRALARELPDRHVRAVELTAEQSPVVVARLLADETLDPAGPVSVAYRDGTRVTRRVAKGTPLATDTPALPFDAGSVVVVTGGARGITARAAVAVAQATGCRLELLGRTPLPAESEDPRTAAATDRAALRRALVEVGELRTPAAIETACDGIMAAREIRATLRTLRDLGCPTTYHSVDVRDRSALHRVLQDVRRRHGRIDAIVHGAGVLDDRLAGGKTDEGFDRVFATKVDAARTLLAQMQHDVRLLVLFGSVSGVFGNRGQVDYGAANDALDELANRLDGADGRRIVSIDWGPWAATPDGSGNGRGMVSPELEREYARRGVGLVDPESGVRALLHEMATLPGEPAQVVVMRAEPEAFVDRRERQPVTWPAATRHDPTRPRHDASPGLTLEDLTERG
jgi:NAD(P)-dependent dehydrogenase (short-subunit alcohol dehydrogenase family)